MPPVYSSHLLLIRCGGGRRICSGIVNGKRPAKK